MFLKIRDCVSMNLLTRTMNDLFCDWSCKQRMAIVVPSRSVAVYSIWHIGCEVTFSLSTGWQDTLYNTFRTTLLSLRYCDHEFWYFPGSSPWAVLPGIPQTPWYENWDTKDLFKTLRDKFVIIRTFSWQFWWRLQHSKGLFTRRRLSEGSDSRRHPLLVSYKIQ